MALNTLFQMVRSENPVLNGSIFEKSWYVLLYNFYNALTKGLSQAPTTLTLNASPSAYQAVIKGQFSVTGGTVSAIDFSRDGVNYYPTGITQGLVQMNAADFVRVTYTVAPTIRFFPM